ncbi:MAG: hypothetical protein OXU50_06060 [Gammaproteobacteria bacterium]|nr:hypothetical protein [Gammaproteobacteria bacterium]
MDKKMDSCRVYYTVRAAGVSSQRLHLRVESANFFRGTGNVCRSSDAIYCYFIDLTCFCVGSEIFSRSEGLQCAYNGLDEEQNIARLLAHGGGGGRRRVCA